MTAKDAETFWESLTAAEKKAMSQASEHDHGNPATSHGRMLRDKMKAYFDLPEASDEA